MAAFSKNISEPNPVKVDAVPSTTDIAVAATPTILDAANKISEFQSLGSIDKLGEQLQKNADQAAQGVAMTNNLASEFLDPNSKRTVEQITGDLVKLQTGQVQGAITPSEARARAATLFRKAVAANPGLAPEFERVYQATGFSASSGSSSGTDTADQILKSRIQDINDAATQGFGNVEQYYEHNRILNSAAEDTARLTSEQYQGTVAYPEAVTKIDNIANASVADLRTRFLAGAKVEGKNLDIEQFVTDSAVEREAAHTLVDRYIAGARKQDITFSEAQRNEMHATVDRKFDVFDKIMQTNDPTAVAKRLNEQTKVFAQKDINEFYSSAGLPGLAMLNSSPDTQATQLSSMIEFARRIKQSGGGFESTLQALTSTAGGDPTGRITQTLNLLHSLSPADANKMLAPYMNNPNKGGGSDDPQDTVLHEIGEQLRSLFIDNNGDLSDPAALKNTIDGITSRWATATTTSNLNKPEFLTQVRNDPEKKRQIDNAVGVRSDIAVQDIESGKFFGLRGNNGSFKFTFDPSRTVTTHHGSWGMYNYDTVQAPFQATETRFGGKDFSVAQQVDVHEDEVQQLNDIYRYKLNTDGLEAANSWAEKIYKQFNPEPDNNTYQNDSGEGFKID